MPSWRFCGQRPARSCRGRESHPRALASSTDADVAWLVLKAPAELAAGTAAGLALGSLAAAPGTHALGAPTRALGALLGAGLAVFGGKELRFSGGGALAAVVLGATASRWWGGGRRCWAWRAAVACLRS